MRVFGLIIDGIVLLNMVLVIVALVLLFKRKLNYNGIVFMENFAIWGKSLIVMLLSIIFYVVFESVSLEVVGYLMISELLYVVIVGFILSKEKDKRFGLILSALGLILASGVLGLLNIIEVL